MVVLPVVVLPVVVLPTAVVAEVKPQDAAWAAGLDSRLLSSPPTLIQQQGVGIQQLWHQVLHALHDVRPQGGPHRCGAGLEADAGVGAQCLLRRRMGGSGC